jgi:hypothetical protein
MRSTGAPSEVLLTGGFRREAPLPSPTAVARLKVQLLEATRGRPDAVRDGLARLGSWASLPALMAGGWFDGASARTATSRRLMEQRLRLLAMAPISPGLAATLPRGQPVWIVGRARRAAEKSQGSYIWVARWTTRDNLRLLIEEGHDFFVQDEAGNASVRVFAQGGYLMAGGRLADGAPVEVMGFVDHAVDPRAAERTAPSRQPPFGAALRSGDDLSLLVRVPPAAAV